MAFVVPPYPHDRLQGATFKAASAHNGGVIDLSIGTPIDKSPASVIAATSNAHSSRGYPPSIGSHDFRVAVSLWLGRNFSVTIDPGSEIGACIGTKEFVASTCSYLKLLDPTKDVVLYPQVSYPTYAMSAMLAGARAVGVNVDDNFRLNLDSIEQADIDNALCLWVNSPGNPCGQIEDLEKIAEWGRANNVLILSDECYAPFTYKGSQRSILQTGTKGVIAVHSLSKRSNLAGIRAGFYAGDSEIVGQLKEIRKHAGLMVPGPIQQGAVVAYGDDLHVELQKATYFSRLERLGELLRNVGFDIKLPDGGIYLWIDTHNPDGWVGVDWLASHAGIMVSPGEFYGDAHHNFIRIAAVLTDSQIDLIAHRLKGAPKFSPQVTITKTLGEN